MVKCICINDSNKPRMVPKHKWIKKGQEYTVIYTTTVLPQKQLGFHLAEINLDETCKPYEYFLANRFGFTDENFRKLMELIEICSDTHFSIKELMKQTEIIEN